MIASTRAAAASGTCLRVRYEQVPGSRYVTDGFRGCAIGGGTLVALADTNGVPAGLAGALRQDIFDDAVRLAGTGSTLAETFEAVRASITGWFARTELPVAGSFVNVALLRLSGATVQYAGAYAPMYIMSPASATRCVDFPGPVAGPAGMMRVRARTGSFELGPAEVMLIASDGLLEARTAEGRITGDSYVRYQGESLMAAPDVHRAVLDLYQQCDAEQRDSRSLLTISRMD
jgi:hypothetical protein